jgi:2,4-dienoyl-CoA reductase-like NADH-dependent reductase (Old Yellow Enzyme family)
MNQKSTYALDGIHKVIADFKAATIRAVSRVSGYGNSCGSRVFIASVSFSFINVRTDAYGGSLKTEFV